MRQHAGLLVTVEGFDHQPDLDAVADSLGIPSSEIDVQYGVILVDPARGMYCIQLKSQIGNPEELDQTNCPWANPPIEPFG